MPIPYYPRIATAQYGSFLKLLFRWRGSIYKIFYIDLLMFSVLFMGISVIYRYFLSESARSTFERVCIYLETFNQLNPVNLVLGFYVVIVTGRWWETFRTIPYIWTPSYIIREIISSAAAEAYVPLRPAVAHHVTARHEVTIESASLAGSDRDSECERVRLKVLRYMITAWLLQMRVFSSPLSRRFAPRRTSFKTSAEAANRTENYDEKINGSTMNNSFHSSSKDPSRQNVHSSRNSSLKDTLEALNQDSYIQLFFPELLTGAEIERIVSLSTRLFSGADAARLAVQPAASSEQWQPEFSIPLAWAADELHSARARGLIANDFDKNRGLQMLEQFRVGLSVLGLMMRFSIPLVYTHVATISVYGFFVLALLSRQLLEPRQTAEQTLLKDALHAIDVYVPVPTLLQLLLYVGWLKVAEVCLNPLGDDDDDFDTRQMLDDNVFRSFTIMHIARMDNGPSGAAQSHSRPALLENGEASRPPALMAAIGTAAGGHCYEPLGGESFSLEGNASDASAHETTLTRDTQ